MDMRILSGSWSKETNGQKGLVDASLSARSIFGSEDDNEYEIVATIIIATGKACVLANHHTAVDWTESYLAFVLDPTANQVRLEAVTRDDMGVELSRNILALRAFTLIADHAYSIKILNRELSDDSRAIYCFIDGLLVCETEELETAPIDYSTGMQGFESLGAAGQYSTYLKNGYSTPAEVQKVLRIYDNNYNAEILDCIEAADELIKSELRAVDITVPTTVNAGSPLNFASKNLAAYEFRQRGVVSANDAAVNAARYQLPGRVALDKFKKENADIPFLVGEADQS